MEAMATPTPLSSALAPLDGSGGGLRSRVPVSSVPSPSPATAFPSYIAYACLYGLGVLYVAPSVISWTRMSRNIYTEDKTAVRLFALLGFGTMLRAVAFVLVAVWMLLVIQSSGSRLEAQHLHMSYVQLVSAWQVLGMTASLVLVSVFLLVFNTWASMTDQVNASRVAAYRSSTLSSSAPAPRILFIRMVLGTNVCQIVAFFLVTAWATSEFLRTLYLFTTMLLALCLTACIFLLPVYGQHMCELLGKVAEGANRRQRNIRRIAAVSTVFFLMRTVSETLQAISQYNQLYPDPDAEPEFRISPKHIIEANPIFFFSSDDSNGLLSWVVLLQVVEFPVEWTLLMLLLCVLPSRAVLPSIRGYQPIPEPKRRL